MLDDSPVRRFGPARLVRCAVGIIAAAVVVACSPARPAPVQGASAPPLTDRLYGLLRQQLTDSAPARLAQAIMCETNRVYRSGAPDASARIAAVFDSAYRTDEDRRAHARVESALAGSVADLGPAACAALDSMSERSYPLRQPASNTHP